VAGCFISILNLNRKKPNRHMNIEIEIPVSELKSVLPGLAKIVPRSSSLPVLRCIKVSLDADNSVVSLQAHNLDEAATVRLPGKANGLSGDVLIPFEILTKIIKGCVAGQSVRFICNGQETRIRYTVVGSSVDRLVSHISVSEWPPVKEINTEATALDDTFKQALREALECASIDSSRYVLNGAFLDTQNKDAHYIVGTDGRHLYSANSFHFNLAESVIVPARKFLAWSGFGEDGPWRVSVLPAVKRAPDAKGNAQDEPAWFRIDSEHWSYAAKAIDGQYPNWKQVIPEATIGWTRIVLQPAAAATMLGALPRLPGGEDIDKPITLAAGNGLVLKARGKDQSEWTKVNVPEATVTGKAVQITLNRTYLLKALRFGFQCLDIKTSLDPLLFTNRGKTLVVMPLRCQAEEPAEAAAEPVVTAPNSAPDAPPSAPEALTPTEERKAMSTATTTITPPVRGNIRIHNPAEDGREETRSAFKTALEHIEGIKVNLRDVMGDLSEAVTMLKAAEREQRASAKEIDAIRSKLREIQTVKI
jgi:DNA polymerase III sliding clamp (beta) subunit (PCNA family)